MLLRHMKPNETQWNVLMALSFRKIDVFLPYQLLIDLSVGFNLVFLKINNLILMEKSLPSGK